jgi:hypothetical protein
MTIRPGFRDLLWMAAGAAMLLVIVLTAFAFNRGQSPAEQLAWHSQRMEMVDAMSLALESAAEAEKSAVLAVTDEDSRAFADQARAASRTVEQRRLDLETLLRSRGTENERQLLTKFGQVFADFQRVDDQILALAVKNTNLKAYALAYGAAAETLRDMEAVLSRLTTAGATSPDLATVTVLALGAEVAALHVQNLLPPHIAEETDEKMAQLEAEMTREEHEVRKDLDAIAAIDSVRTNPNLEAALSRWGRYLEIKTQILALSHENTNVLSLALSLNRKRQVTAACQDALTELRAAIKAEPIANGMNFDPALPR